MDMDKDASKENSVIFVKLIWTFPLWCILKLYIVFKDSVEEMTVYFSILNTQNEI